MLDENEPFFKVYRYLSNGGRSGYTEYIIKGDIENGRPDISYLVIDRKIKAIGGWIDFNYVLGYSSCLIETFNDD